MTGGKFTCESKWTDADKIIHLFLTYAIVLTWITSTFIDVSLAKSSCNENSGTKHEKTTCCNRNNHDRIQVATATSMILQTF